MWDLSSPTRIEPVSPALAGGFLTNGPPGKSLIPSLLKKYLTVYLFQVNNLTLSILIQRPGLWHTRPITMGTSILFLSNYTGSLSKWLQVSFKTTTTTILLEPWVAVCRMGGVYVTYPRLWTSEHPDSPMLEQKNLNRTNLTRSGIGHGHHWNCAVTPSYWSIATSLSLTCCTGQVFTGWP